MVRRRGYNGRLTRRNGLTGRVVVDDELNPTINSTGADLWMWAASAPLPSRVKLKWFCTSLLAVTVNGMPAAVGVTVRGEGLHVGGTAPEQRRLTGLL